ncbi:MAG: sulfurtransferase-like selenium metabolism protein YedF [Defluviitaleaceae bacterium]|nr:sulfurtransferase-like selenium metabolism protein YedF [Defluviitaleaceae bacterium]
MEIINCIGDICPVPVVKLRNALVGKTSGKIQIMVDNDISLENLRRFTIQKGHNFSYTQDEEKYLIVIEISDISNQAASAQTENLVVMSSQIMGNGDDVLGGILTKSFVFALTQSENLPKKMIFYNSAVKLCLDDSPILQDLQTLEKSGVLILVCGTCLDFFNVINRLSIGEITNMYSILEAMQSANCIIKP